jgi:hypothetical protein
MGGLAVHLEHVRWEVPMAHDVAGLERKVRALQEAVTKFNTAKHADRLLTIIHKPGWTTEPEHELVVAHLDSFHSQVSGLHKACDTLLTIAEKIGLNPQPLPP